MEKQYSKLDVFRGASVVAVALLTLILLALLPGPGFRQSRLILFALIILAGWIGAAGAVWNRFSLLAVGAAGLFLLGFWQFTIGLIILPTAAILVITAILVSEPPDSTPAVSE